MRYYKLIPKTRPEEMHKRKVLIPQPSRQLFFYNNKIQRGRGRARGQCLSRSFALSISPRSQIIPIIALAKNLSSLDSVILNELSQPVELKFNSTSTYGFSPRSKTTPSSIPTSDEIHFIFQSLVDFQARKNYYNFIFLKNKRTYYILAF